MKRTRPVRTLPLGLLVAVLLGTSAPAQADMRVWKSEQNDEAGEPTRYLDLTAFAQPGYIVRSPFADDANAGVSDSGPWLQRARSGFRAQVEPWLRLRMEVEFAPVPLLQDAYVDAQVLPFLNVRMGQFLVPFLRAYQFNELNLGFLDRPIYTPVTPDRNYLRYLSPRDIGVMLFGFIGDADPAKYDPVLEYRIGAFMGRGPNVTRNDDDALLYSARLEMFPFGVPKGVEAESDLAWNPYPKAAIGAAVYSNCDDRANWNRGFTLDGDFRWRGLYSSAAVVWFKNGKSSGLGNALGYKDFCVGSKTASGDPLTFVSRGVQWQVQYVLPPALFPVEGQALEALFRFDWVDPVSPYASGNPFFGGGAGSSGY
ncbi:MAG: hypothetical protein R3A78_02135, partial [Polyangiales bacterium]